MSQKSIPYHSINTSWTLFLDRDGVINRRIIDGYITNYRDFIFLDNVLVSIKILSRIFGKVIVITNQQGVGKKIMTKTDMDTIHQNMINDIIKAGGRIDKIYTCTDLAESNSKYRKPKTGMIDLVLNDFKNINLKKSIMVGDRISDMIFGENAGTYTVFISDAVEVENNYRQFIDDIKPSLFDFAKNIFCNLAF